MAIKISSEFIQSRDARLASIWALDESGSKENIVVFVHGGPNGSKDGPGSTMLFRKLQEMFLKNNIESVRFDFMGEGESSGDYVNTTLSTQVDDFQVILKKLKELGYKNISIVAESFGVSCVVGHNPNQFSKLVLLWGAVFFFDDGKCFAPWFTEERKKEMAENGFISEGSQKIGIDFLNEIEKVHNLKVPFSKIDVPTLVVHGMADSEVPLSHDCFELYKNMKNNSKVVLFPGLDHFLQIPNSDGGFKHDLLYTEILDWLKV